MIQFGYHKDPDVTRKYLQKLVYFIYVEKVTLHRVDLCELTDFVWTCVKVYLLRV